MMCFLSHLLVFNTIIHHIAVYVNGFLIFFAFFKAKKQQRTILTDSSFSMIHTVGSYADQPQKYMQSAASEMKIRIPAIEPQIS